MMTRMSSRKSFKLFLCACFVECPINGGALGVVRGQVHFWEAGVCLVACNSPRHPRRSCHSQALGNKESTPSPTCFLSLCVPAVSGPLACPVSHWLLAAEKENSQVSIPRGPDWRQGCSGMSLLAEKFNYSPLTRPKALCFHSASLLSSQVLVTSRCVSVKVQVWRTGRWCRPRGFQSSPRRRIVYVLPSALLHSLLLEIPQTSEWAKSEFAWQQMHSFTEHLLRPTVNQDSGKEVWR